MNIYLLLLLILILIGLRIYPIKFNKNYLSKEYTACIKGIFILIVFCSHIITYIPYNPTQDNLALFFVKNIGQLMVTLFLFYSGYGVYESIKKKKIKYINGMPKNRIFKTLFHFDIIVLLFILINCIMGYGNNVLEILSSLIAWSSVGNSNWYIFVILVLYFITYLSFIIFKKENKNAIILCTLLTILTIIALSTYKESYWYNTMLCYPFGMMFSYHKNKINKLMLNNKTYYLTLVFLFLLFIGIRRVSTISTLYYSVFAIIFVIIVVMLTMKSKINNKYLKWFGDNLFYIYILQRIPMLILSRLSYSNTHPYRFVIICFISTILLTIIYGKLLPKIDKYIFNIKINNFFKKLEVVYGKKRD